MIGKLALLLALAHGAAAQSFSTAAALEAPFSEPPPMVAECPECSIGTFRCPQVESAGAPKSCMDPNFQLRRLRTDFSYVQGTCWEVIPRDRHSVQVDLDIWCRQGPFMQCSMMERHDISAISILSGCSPASGKAAELVSEKCTWVCKHGKPVARCLWTFDPVGMFQATQGGLETCWLSSTCTGTDVEVTATCRPTALWQQANSSKADMAKVREVLTSTHVARQRAEKELSQATAAHSSLVQRLQETEAQLNATNQALMQLRGSMSTAAVQEQSGESNGLVIALTAALGCAVLFICVLGAIVALRGRRRQQHLPAPDNKSTPAAASDDEFVSDPTEVIVCELTKQMDSGMKAIDELLDDSEKPATHRCIDTNGAEGSTEAASSKNSATEEVHPSFSDMNDCDSETASRPATPPVTPATRKSSLVGTLMQEAPPSINGDDNGGVSPPETLGVLDGGARVQAADDLPDFPPPLPLEGPAGADKQQL
uniref:Uncharacterized protein n=1 Tax=Alexandrium monilatum TaxID=311494 RepID=A0A7S4Q9L2_9DINO|mmetsp:Transcript_78117/g.246777  ORF Transcript_78117/g.246777 Transcript_78117/m.246777 type:complete len:484 (-) Transcript_78117:42-1493(-)